ncbi:CocE/NonD family hydrolase [Gordonia desulfuricans]|uniref:CocE/NonD family hydrolase n=1 Tax=Gordonia desulfuricans TaxID=89051 RepID=A0A7K3LJX3_9ACTN|nr:CocE/NonD family hydrolase [Gordonia desulfuricans]NDK88508.1 CocE/NonD family hydrolase [Gordonia desulfuricans]
MTYQLDTRSIASARFSTGPRPAAGTPAAGVPSGGIPSGGTASVPHFGTLPLGDPTGGADGIRWREAVDGPQTYPRVVIDRDVTIEMSDGVQLRATVIRPANRFGQTVLTPYPAIVNINPYNRASVDFLDATTHAPVLGKAVRSASASIDATGTALAGLTRLTGTIAGGVLDVFGINRTLVRSGYVQVVVDVRGTGSSEGKWQILGEREQQDSVEIISWAAGQDWCNGKVGLAGWSYSAINSLQAADKRPAELGAVFAVEGCDDIVRDVYITGGMPSAFIPLWLSAVNILKWVPNPSTYMRDLVRGNTLRWFRDRITSPATEMPSLLWGFLTARDDRIFDDPYFDERDPQIDRIEAPTFTVGGWHDLFGRSATGVYERLQMEPGRKQMLVGDGYHADVGFGHGGRFSPPRLDVLERAWFDRWLKGHRNGIEFYGPVTMHQQGGQWTSGTSFPRDGVRPQRLYLVDESSDTADHAVHDGSLSSSPGGSVSDLHVRPDLRGMVSRDMTQVTAGVTMMFGEKFTVDARFQERGALSFTTAPAEEAVTLSGAMNLRLNVATTAHEGIWAVTVNDVAPDGTSRVLSNGALSASNRALDPSSSTYASDGSLVAAHHYLSRKRKMPVPTDEPVRIDVDLVPTDAVIEPGHRLRVDVYAASFPRYLTVVPDLIKARGRRQRLVLDPAHPSYLTFQAAGAFAEQVSATETTVCQLPIEQNDPFGG